MNAGVGRVTTVAMIATVVLGTSALGYGVARATTGLGLAGPADVSPSASTSPTTSSAPSSTPTPAARAARRPSHVSAPLPAQRPRVTPPPGPPLFGPGDEGDRVRELQARLRQIAWLSGNVTDDYGPDTTAAVKGFQAKREIAVTGYVDQRTLDRLLGMTRDPTADELANKLPGSLLASSSRVGIRVMACSRFSVRWST